MVFNPVNWQRFAAALSGSHRTPAPGSGMATPPLILFTTRRLPGPKPGTTTPTSRLRRRRPPAVLDEPTTPDHHRQPAHAVHPLILSNRPAKRITRPRPPANTQTTDQGRLTPATTETPHYPLHSPLARTTNRSPAQRNRDPILPGAAPPPRYTLGVRPIRSSTAAAASTVSSAP